MTCPHELKGRPIAAGSKSPTIPIRELLGKLLSPLAPHLKTYVKDDRDFSRILPRTIDYEGTLLSCDVVSLYTSIPHELGIQALQFWLNKLRPQKDLPSNLLSKPLYSCWTIIIFYLIYFASIRTSVPQWVQSSHLTMLVLQWGSLRKPD